MQNKQEKRATIQRNIEARAERSPTQQLKELDRRLGSNVGAKKERAKLNRIISGEAA